MFIGHFAAGFAAKRIAPNVSLGVFFAAAQFLDLLWPILLLVGIEKAEIEVGNTAFTPLNFVHYPISHSLCFALLWTSLITFLYFLFRRDERGALVVGTLILSHWVLDVIVHRPDLEVFPGGPAIGLGLWNHVALTILLESALFVASVYLYLRTTGTRKLKRNYPFWLLLILLIAAYLGSAFGPPPPNMNAVAIAGNAMWLFVILAHWADRIQKSAAGPVS